MWLVNEIDIAIALELFVQMNLCWSMIFFHPIVRNRTHLAAIFFINTSLSLLKIPIVFSIEMIHIILFVRYCRRSS